MLKPVYIGHRKDRGSEKHRHRGRSTMCHDDAARKEIPMAELIKNVEHASIFALKDLVEIEPGRVNSLTLSQTPGCKMTVFAIDADEGMSSHAASGDALITVLEGTGEITVNGVPHQLSAGQSIVMTSGSPHSVRGVTPFKMQLTVVKPAE